LEEPPIHRRRAGADLGWIGMSLEDEERPEKERSELTLTSPTLAEITIAWSLEYVANLIEHFLPRHLRTWDHASDRIIAERCRGIACAVRQIKLSRVLDQSISASEMASWLVPAIGPIVLGDWNKIAYVELHEQPTLPKSVSYVVIGWSWAMIGVRGRSVVVAAGAR
jgi:hypothetical protein